MLKVLLITSAILASLSQISEAQTTKPNVVVVLTDDQDDTGSMDAMPQTRALLAEHGVTFTNSFVDFSLCCPSRASWMTGEDAHNHRIIGNTKATGGGYAKFAPHEGNTVSVWLQAAGYRTAFMGKVMNGYGKLDPTHVLPGWDRWVGAAGRTEYFDYDLNEDGIIVHYGTEASDYQTDVLAQKAVDFINAQSSDVPFYLVVTPKAPHGPATPAPRHVGAFANLPFPISPNFNEADVSDKPNPISGFSAFTQNEIRSLTSLFRERRETLLAVDDLVAEVVNALDAQGLLANTIIVFSSDNGWSHGSHRWVGKQVIYEESIRVPLIIRGPGIPENQTRDQLVNNADVIATILEQAKATPGLLLDGKSLTPIINDASAPWRTALLVQGSFKYEDDGDSNQDINLTFFGVRGTRYVYSQISNGERELYDLFSDPFELTNVVLAPEHGSVVTFYQNLLGPLSACAGDSCWITTEPNARQVLHVHGSECSGRIWATTRRRQAGRHGADLVAINKLRTAYFGVADSLDDHGPGRCSRVGGRKTRLPAD
jgi:arylsulfatase A-like enzyme